MSTQPPSFANSNTCHNCECFLGFWGFKWRHHCRACGNSFCAECSKKTSIIPQYGIGEQVRVCDSCYNQIQRSSASNCHKCKTVLSKLNCRNINYSNTNEAYCCKCWKEYQQENGQDVATCNTCPNDNTSDLDEDRCTSMCFVGSVEAIHVATALSLSEREQSRRRVSETPRGSVSDTVVDKCLACQKQTDNLWKTKNCEHTLCRSCLQKGICNVCQNLIEDAYKLRKY